METNSFILVRSAGLPFTDFLSLSIEESKIYQISEEQWNSIKQEHLKILLNFSKSETLLNGLLYSSHSFIDRIDQLHQKAPCQYRKKESQTIRRLTQYLGRICGKTIPFSSFSTIFLLNYPQIFESKCLLNIQVIQRIIEDKGLLQLNPTFRFLNGKYVWLSMKVLDKINVIQKEDSISLVIQSIKNSKSKQDLISEISKGYDIDQNELIPFIDQLIESEILIFKNNVDFENADKISKKIISNQKIDKSFIHKLYNNFVSKYTDLNFPRERLFYEHQNRAIKLEIKPKDLLPIKIQLNSLYQYLFFSHKDDLDDQLLEIWNLLKIKESEIEFIDFYQRVLQLKIEIPSIKVNYKYQLKKSNNVIKVILPFIDTTTPSFGVICQIYSQNGCKSYLNNFTTGYGKHFGRFLPMLPKEVFEYIKEKNRNSKHNLVSNTNFHLSNVDLHPEMIQTEIDFSKSLKIRKNGNMFELYENEKKIKILDLSIEHPKFKSIRYQLLNLFGFANISKNRLIKKISAEVSIETNYGKYIPQIEYADIIIQREIWIINLKHLINPNIKSQFQYFEDIQKWKSEIGIANYCYVSSTDHPKLQEPQLINFNSPHFIELFKSVSRKITTKIILEKMIPQSDQFKKQSGESFLHEFLIEFEEN